MALEEGGPLKPKDSGVKSPAERVGEAFMRAGELIREGKGIAEARAEAIREHNLNAAEIAGMDEILDTKDDAEKEAAGEGEGRPARREPETTEEIQARLDELKKRRNATRENLAKQYGQCLLVKLEKGAAPTYVDTEGNVYVTMGNGFPGRLPPGGSYNFGKRSAPQWKKWLGKDAGGWVEATEEDIRRENENPTLVQLDESTAESRTEEKPAKPEAPKDIQKVDTPYTDAELANAKDNLSKTLDSLGDFPDMEAVRGKIADAKTPDDVKGLRDQMQSIIGVAQKVETKKVAGKDPLKKRVPPSEPLAGTPGVYSEKIADGITWHETASGDWVLKHKGGAVTFATPEQIATRTETEKRQQEIAEQKKQVDKAFEEQQKAIAEQLQKTAQTSFEKPPKAMPEAPKVPEKGPEVSPQAAPRIVERRALPSEYVSWKNFDPKHYEGIQILTLDEITRDETTTGLFYELLESIASDMVRKDGTHILAKILHKTELTPEEEKIIKYGQYRFSKWYPRGEAFAKRLESDTTKVYKKEEILKYALQNPLGFERWEAEEAQKEVKKSGGLWDSVKKWF